MKKIALLLLAALALVIAIMVVRTVLMPSQQLAATKITKIPLDEEELAARLARAIAIPTVSHEDESKNNKDDFDALLALYQANYPRVHDALTREIVGSHALLYTWKGSDPTLPAVLLLAHNDVVPVVPARWSKPPFSGAVEDGFIWGRGTLDDKSVVVSIFEAAESMLASGIQPKRTILFAFGDDEEVGGKRGATRIAARLVARGTKVAYALDEGMSITHGLAPGIKERPVAFIGVAEKGYVTMELVVEGEGGHSSMPPAHTAVGILSRAVARIEDNQMPGGTDGVTGAMFDALGPEAGFGLRLVFANRWLLQPILAAVLTGTNTGNAMYRTTTAPTMLRGSAKDNVLAQRATASINFRIRPGDTIASIEAHLRRVVDDERVKINANAAFGSEASPVSPAAGEGFDDIRRTIGEVYGDVVVAPNLVLAATDARHYAAVTSRIYRFSPIHLHKIDIPRLHGVDERIGVSDYADMVRFYRRLMTGS